MREKNIIISILFVGMVTWLIFMLTSVTIKIERDRASMYNCISNNIWCEKYKN